MKPSSSYIPVRSRDLPLGVAVGNPILDVDGEVLQSPGLAITLDLLSVWRQRNIREVFLHADDAHSLGLSQSNVSSDNDRPLPNRESVSSDRYQFESETVTRPPQAMIDFVKRHHFRSPGDAQLNKRREKRYPLQGTVLIIPVDEQYKPAGGVFEAILRDVSSAGVAIVNARAITYKFLALEMAASPTKKMRRIVEVLRCRPVGLFYEIGAKFVAKID